MIPKHIKKRAYEVGHFFEDCIAADWLNEKFDEGYVVESLSSCVMAGRQDRRKQEVRMTIIMRLHLGKTATVASRDTPSGQPESGTHAGRLPTAERPGLPSTQTATLSNGGELFKAGECFLEPLPIEWLSAAQELTNLKPENAPND